MSLHGYLKLVWGIISEKTTLCILSASFLFSFLYSLFCLSNSYFYLSGDNLNIATLLYPSLHPDIFNNEFSAASPASYYLPSFTGLLKFIYGFAGSYMLTLKILTAVYLFATLATAYIFLKTIFVKTSWKFLLPAVYILVLPFAVTPSHEVAGFTGAYAAIARTGFMIFVPVVISMLYRNIKIRVLKFRIPAIIPVLLLNGICFQFHPILGADLAVIISLYWLFANGRINGFGARIFSLSAGLFLFGVIAFATYIAPMHAVLRQNAEQLSAFSNDISLKQADSMQSAVNTQAYSASQACSQNKVYVKPAVLAPWYKVSFCGKWGVPGKFLAELCFIIPLAVLFYLIYAGGIAVTCGERRMWRFFIRLLAVSYFGALAGGLVFDYFSNTQLLFGLKRIDKLLLFNAGISLIFVIWVILRREKSGTARFISIAAVILLWTAVAETHIMGFPAPLENLIRKFTTGIGTPHGIFNILLIFVLVPMLIFFRSKFVYVTACVVFAFSILTGGLFLLGSNTLNAFAGLGSWELVSKVSGASGYKTVKAFDEASAWAVKNIPASEKVLFLDEDKSQAMKVATVRQGLSMDQHELGIAPEKAAEIVYMKSKIYSKTWDMEDFLKANGIRWVYYNMDFRKKLSASSKILEPVFDNGKYVIAKVRCAGEIVQP